MYRISFKESNISSTDSWGPALFHQGGIRWAETLTEAYRSVSAPLPNRLVQWKNPNHSIPYSVYNCYNLQQAFSMYIVNNCMFEWYHCVPSGKQCVVPGIHARSNSGLCVSPAGPSVRKSHVSVVQEVWIWKCKMHFWMSHTEIQAIKLKV